MIINTVTKSKQIPFLGYQKSNKNSKKKQQSLDLRFKRDKLISNSYPGVHELKYSCRSVYNGETKKIISISIDHQQGNIKSSWSYSGVTEHTK